MYYLHESSCRFQFMRRLSIHSTVLAGEGELAPRSPLKKGRCCFSLMSLTPHYQLNAPLFLRSLVFLLRRGGSAGMFVHRTPFSLGSQWVKTTAANFPRALARLQSDVPRYSARLQSALGGGVGGGGAAHQASLQRPNLLASIDIPFPLSLLSCFAFRGFALSPECPACGL